MERLWIASQVQNASSPSEDRTCNEGNEDAGNGQFVSLKLMSNLKLKIC